MPGRFIISAVFAFVALAACEETSSDAVTPLTPAPGGVSSADVPGEIDVEPGDDVSVGTPEQCDAEDYRGMIGTSIAAATFPESPDLRVFGEDDIITQEYIPTRTNVLYGNNGIIKDVYCG